MSSKIIRSVQPTKKLR